jgi:hypothetical protein
MSDRFVVVLVECTDNEISTMEIRNRGALELKHSRSTPYSYEVKSISDKWALLYEFVESDDSDMH